MNVRSTSSLSKGGEINQKSDDIALEFDQMRIELDAYKTECAKLKGLNTGNHYGVERVYRNEASPV